MGSVLCSFNNFPLINRHFPILFPKSPTRSPLPFIFLPHWVSNESFWCFWTLFTWHMPSTFFLILHFHVLLTPAKPVLGLTKLSPKERCCSVGSECWKPWKLSEKQVWFSLPLLWGSMVWILFCFTPVKIESNPSCNKAVEKVTETQQWDEAFTQSSKTPGCR